MICVGITLAAIFTTAGGPGEEILAIGRGTDVGITIVRHDW